MPKEYYSSYRNQRLLKKATLTLLDGNIETLLNFMYDPSNHQGIFGHPEIRIGLSIKLLHNLRGKFSDKLIQPILTDIEELLDNDDYLEGTGNAEQRRQCLDEEYQFVQKYLDIDDNITLNTEYRPTLPNPNINSNSNQTGGKVKGLDLDLGQSELTTTTIGPLGPIAEEDFAGCILM